MMLIRKGTGEDPRLIEKDNVHYLEFEALKKQSWLTQDVYKRQEYPCLHVVLPVFLGTAQS